MIITINTLTFIPELYKILKMRASNQSPSRVNNQSQHKKIFCAYHQTQFLTNFCLQKQCLMPLCPSCVVEHTEQHYQVKQKPTYVNLNDALTEVKNKCYAQVSELQEFHRVNEQIMNYIQGLKLYIRKQLNMCKQTVFDQISVLFAQHEATLYKQITQKYRQQQVYDLHESIEVKNSILQNIQSLYDKASLFKGDQCLSTLIKYYGEDQEIIDENIQIIKQYLQKNKNAGGIHIGLNEQQVESTFKGLCETIVNLKTVTEKDLIEEGNSNKNRKKGGLNETGNKKPITISSRLKSPFDHNKKNINKQKYESPFREKNYKIDRDNRSSNTGAFYH